MPYTYEYPRPALTVDALVFAQHDNKPSILLIQRKNPPFEGFWAFPGGFVNENEECETAVIRELEEETQLTGLKFELFTVASNPKRDPRGRTISVLYFAVIQGSAPIVVGGDDAASAQWHPIVNLPNLAFDHTELLADFLRVHRSRVFPE
ncbi:MAG: hypothetical protein RIS47_1431 [Bacteroidota bacterium]|jgi:8-oxo-dGTP diphosphatase